MPISVSVAQAAEVQRRAQAALAFPATAPGDLPTPTWRADEVPTSAFVQMQQQQMLNKAASRAFVAHVGR